MKWLLFILLLSALGVNAQSVIERRYYFEESFEGQWTNVIYIRAFTDGNVEPVITHDDKANCISFIIGKFSTTNGYASLQYFYGNTNIGSLIPSAPRLLPDVLPERTLAQLAAASLMVSNRVWQANHPAPATAKPKIGNRPLATKITSLQKLPVLPAIPTKVVLPPPLGTPPTPIPAHQAR